MTELPDQTDDEDEDDSFCVLNLKVSVGSVFEESSHFVTHYKGEILVGDECDTSIGEISFYVADLLRATENGHSAWEVLDSVDGLLAHFCPLITHRSSQFVPSVARLAECDLDGLLALGSLEIEPAYRGKGWGLSAINTACQRFAVGCSLAVLKAYPTQREGKGFDTSAQFRRDRAKLMKHYSRAGFEPILSRGLMARRLFD